MKKKNKKSPNREPAGWHNRGYLPHFDGGKQQFITFRLGDSMPQTILDTWRKELEKEGGANFDSILRRRVEAYIDPLGLCIPSPLPLSSIPLPACGISHTLRHL